MNTTQFETATATATSPIAPPTMEQLEQWINGMNSSIYIHWAPSELNTEIAEKYFSILGSIDRVEFVPHKNGNGKMMFVHFHYWNNSPEGFVIRKNIIDASPNGYPLPIQFQQLNGMIKTYQMMCRVNLRPIQKVEYNTHQLTDMFERLNKRVSEEMKTMRDEMDEMKRENQMLREQIAHLLHR